jgi:hypothetical protein
VGLAVLDAFQLLAVDVQLLAVDVVASSRAPGSPSTSRAST